MQPFSLHVYVHVHIGRTLVHKPHEPGGMNFTNLVQGLIDILHVIMHSFFPTYVGLEKKNLIWPFFAY